MQDVVIWHEDHGLSPDDIVAQYPTISLADVYSALAYYHDHRDEIRRAIEEDHAYAERFRKDHPDKLLSVNSHHGQDA